MEINSGVKDLKVCHFDHAYVYELDIDNNCEGDPCGNAPGTSCVDGFKQYFCECPNAYIFDGTTCKQGKVQAVA